MQRGWKEEEVVVEEEEAQEGKRALLELLLLHFLQSDLVHYESTNWNGYTFASGFLRPGIFLFFHRHGRHPEQPLHLGPQLVQPGVGLILIPLGRSGQQGGLLRVGAGDGQDCTNGGRETNCSFCNGRWVTDRVFP